MKEINISGVVGSKGGSGLGVLVFLTHYSREEPCS